MSFDLYPTENEQALADKAPVMSIEPGAFEGMQWIPNLTMRSFAQAGRAISMAGAVAPILADKVRGGTELQDRYFKQHEDLYQRAVDAWTPKSNEVGTAARVVGDLISTLPMAIAAPPLAILSAQMGTAEDLVRAGVPEGKAQAVGAIQGAGMGLGIWMPILGKNLWQRTVVGGAGFNTLQGVVTRGASGAILEGTPAEDQFKAFDGEAMTLDVLLGLGFGAFTHINPDARAQGAEAWDRAAKWAERFSPSQKAAIATLREAQHLNVDSTPGKPVAHADIEAHVNRMRTAIDQLANDKPVQVEDMPAPRVEPAPVREQENVQRTADLINIADRVREEEGIPRVEDLNAAGKTVAERLIDLGIPEEEARSKGLLWDSFFGSMAKQANTTPEALMAKYFGGISKGEGGMTEDNVQRLNSAIARYLGTEKSPFELTPQTPADLAARARDAELAAKGDAEAQKRMQDRAAADALREHFQLTGSDRAADEAGQGSLFQVVRQNDRTLLIQHNLSAENLLHAERMGGMPVPSLAITKAAHPLTGFGDITLLGSKEMADPKGYAKTKVFGADIYSPRYPTVHFKIDAKGQKALDKVLAPFNDLTGERHFELDELQKNGVRYLEEDARVMAAFLDSKGIKVETVRKAPTELSDALKPFSGDTRLPHELAADPEFIKAVYQAHEDVLVKVNGEDYRESAKEEVAQLKANAEERGVSYLVRRAANDVARYQRDLRDAGAVDRVSTKNALRNAIEQNDLGRELQGYAKNLLESLEPSERIFKGYNSQGSYSYMPHTLENVVKILKKELVGGENFNYGVGSIRAKFTPQFRSIEQIRGAKDRLMGKAEFEAVKDEIDNDFFSVSEQLAPYHPIGGEFRFTDTMTSMMYDAASMGIPRALKENGFTDVPAEQQKAIAEFLNKLRTLPTEYFEAKILRDVSLSEFSGAVVPDNVDPKVIETLKAKGINDIRTYKHGDEADRTAKIGGFDNLLFQSAAPTFYSELGKRIEDLPMNAAPAQGWRDTLKGMVSKGKIKQAEIDATGLNDWLDLQDGKVSKEQVQEFLKNNGVTVEEVELGKSGASADITALERKYPDAVLADASNGKQGPMSDADFQTWQRATRRVRETEPSKFDEKQLPGGENYRELLLTLPTKIDGELPEGFEVREFAEGRWGVFGPGPLSENRYGSGVNREAALRTFYNLHGGSVGAPVFKSTHFDQPNILAHVRFNERTDADGKRVLFLEELQSDWAQKGRKEGFALSSEEVERIRGPIRNTYEKYGAWPTAEMMPAEEWAAFNAAQDESDRLNLSSTGKDNRVPSAPFVGKTEAWVALALKRMIRYAAENGFDRVAWTMGEQQAERYDLSKQISRIVLHDNSSGGIGAPKMEGEFTGGNLTAYDHSGQAVIDRRYIQTARELEDQIGKEAAEKLLKATPAERRLAGIGLREKEISGLDLKVGGEGMKGFYDKIVPAVANDVLKKLGGGKVGTVDLGPIEGTNEYGESIDESVTPSESGIQPGFDITPALREKVMAGQPLFQDNRGYLQFGPGSKMSIGLLASADRSTFLHESGHFFLEVMNDLSKEIPALQGEMETVFKWLGVKDADAWNTLSLDEKRPYHEQWARGFEAYLMEGKAPNERLKSAFARFRDWLIEVYKSAVNLNVTLSDEVRGVMDRMLDSQAAHPSEPPRAPAEGAGTPPPGKVGEAPAARSDLDQALAAGKPNLTAPRGLEHPDIRETLQDMAANETGWAEVGGRMLRIPDASMESGERIDRTKWIPKEEWWAARPGPKRLNEAQVQEAVRKALAGEPMNAAEKRTVEFMREVANDRLDSVQQIGEERFGEMLEDAQLEDLPPTTENAFDSMTARRAYDLDLEAYEAAVDRYNVHEDDGLFMAEVRSIIHEAEQQRGAGSQDHPGGAAERGARPGEADPAAESAGQRSAPRDYVSTEAERIATDNPERRVHVGLDADGKPLTVTAREFLDNARNEADRIRQDANLFQIVGECLLSQL